MYNVKTCLECEGKKYITSCKNYGNIDQDPTCVWYLIIQEDIEKIKTGKGVPTFRQLEKIIREDEYDNR